MEEDAVANKHISKAQLNYPENTQVLHIQYLPENQNAIVKQLKSQRLEWSYLTAKMFTYL